MLISTKILACLAPAFLLVLHNVLSLTPSGQESSQDTNSAPLSPQLAREIETFESMIKYDPKNISLRYTIGLLYQLAGRPQEVCDYLYSAYQMDPHRATPELFFHLANNRELRLLIVLCMQISLSPILCASIQSLHLYTHNAGTSQSFALAGAVVSLSARAIVRSLEQ